MTRPRKSKPKSVEHAKLSPASEFERPGDVVDARELAEQEKRTVLNQWEVDAQALSRASDEGMGGGEASRLAEVQSARRKVAGGKFGGGSPTKDRRTSGKPQP